MSSSNSSQSYRSLEVVNSVLSRLTGLGLLSHVQREHGGGEMYYVNPFGELCVRQLTKGRGEDTET